MFQFRQTGSIIINKSKSELSERIYEAVDIDYPTKNPVLTAVNYHFSDKPKKLLFGKVTQNGFYFSGKRIPFKKGLERIEINGTIKQSSNSILVDYQIESKAMEIIRLIIIDIVIILILAIMLTTKDLIQNDFLLLTIFVVFIIILNFLITIGLKNDIRSGEKFLLHILNAP